MARVEHSDIWY